MSNQPSPAARTDEGKTSFHVFTHLLIGSADAARQGGRQPSEDPATRLLLDRMASVTDVAAIDDSSSLYGRLLDECRAKANTAGARNRFRSAVDMQDGGPINISGMARSLEQHIVEAIAEGVDPIHDAGIRMMTHHMASIGNVWELRFQPGLRDELADASRVPAPAPVVDTTEAEESVSAPRRSPTRPSTC